MNAYVYYTMIVPFIPQIDRPILSRRDIHLRHVKNRTRLTSNALVRLHLGSPCSSRCICRSFRETDIVNAFYFALLRGFK